MLEFQNVTKLYSDTRGARGAVGGVRDISFTVGDSEFVSIVGRSGCGKSTLLKIVAGLLKPDRGTILIDGHAVVPGTSEVALVFQEPTMLPWRSVVANVELGLETQGTSSEERRNRAMEALIMVGLDAFADVAPYRLSGGMQQRVGVARALAVRPRVLLMDEPFAAVDAFTREALRGQLLELWSKLGMSVMFVTHDIDEAIFLGNRICVLGSAPGQLLDILEVPLEYPREESEIRESQAGVDLRRRVVSLLQRGGAVAIESQGVTA